MSLACLPPVPPAVRTHTRPPARPPNPARRHKSAIGGGFRCVASEGEEEEETKEEELQRG
jgi:hypothetical protein